MKYISLLGSTGSIGRNVLDVVRKRPREFGVLALAAGRYSSALESQIKEFSPKFVSVSDAAALPRGYRAKGFELLVGRRGLENLGALAGADIVFNAVVGAVGVYPLAAALKRGTRVALANKESVVIAGDYIRNTIARGPSPSRRRSDAGTLRKKNTGFAEGLAVGDDPSIIPVDSEHSAIFQCLEGRRSSDVSRIIVTASGGALYGKKTSGVSVAEVLRHPTWKMGKKITVDSATLMNKGLEVIEAHHLFGLPYDKITTVIHPQSIVHSLVEFVDGSVLAQLSPADMRHAIQYALTWPGRLSSGLPRLSLENIGRLEFEKPDFRRFPCFGLAVAAGRAGGIMPAVMNAANEVAVADYLAGKVRFEKIPRIVEKTMSKFKNFSAKSLDDIVAADGAARKYASEASL